MKSLFDNEKSRHVKSFKYKLVRYKESDMDESGQDSEDHSVMGHERRNMVQVAINLNELFERRRIKHGGQPVEICKVLLVGNPGTGKFRTVSVFVADYLAFRKDLYH